MHAHKRTLYLVLLTLALLLVAAVPAWAAASLTVTQSTSNAKEVATYTFDATGLSLDVADVAEKAITVSFPSGFDLTPTSSQQVWVTVAVGSTNYYCQVAPTIAGTKATITVPVTALPSSGTVSQVKIAGLKVKNAVPATSPATYTVSVKFADTAGTTVSTTVQIVLAVYEVTIDNPVNGASVTAGNVTVKGYVKDANGNGMANKTVVLTPGNVSVTTVQLPAGYFEGSVSLTTATAPNSTTIRASCDGKENTVSVYVNAAGPAKLVLSVKPSALTKDTVSEKFTVQLRDQYNNVAKAPSNGVNVFLSCYDGSGNPAGVFYSDASGTQQVTSLAITADNSSADFYLKPAVAGQVTVAATATGLTGTSASYNVVAKPTKATLSAPQPTQVDASGKVIAGYPVKFAVTLDAAADQDYTVNIALSGINGATYDTQFNATYGAAGSNPTLKIAKGQGVLTFYVYVPTSAAGTLTVTLSGTNPSLTVAGSPQTVTFVTVTTAPDFDRTLLAGWNVLSTPLPLAGAGDLASLVGGSDKFEIAYTFENGQWQQVSTQKLEPLKGYFVKMRAAGAAAYNLARVTSPDQAVPATRQLRAGWNLVGVSTPNDGFTVAQILASVSDKYSAVVNPGLGNTTEFSAVTPDSANKATRRGDAYWVYMKADGTLAGLAVPQLISP